MNSSLFKEYYDLKQQLEKLEEKKEYLQIQIMDALDDEGKKEVKTPWGQFFIMGRRTYEYSGNVLRFQDQLKQMKKQEEAEGIATLKSDSRHIRLVLEKN